MTRRVKIFHPNYSVVDYEEASTIIIEKAMERTSFAVSALAVHGLVTSLTDRKLGQIINNVDLIVPDGQPVKWAMNKLYNTRLKDRVYGPKLTLEVLKKANQIGLKVFLYGSTLNTVKKFRTFIENSFPNVEVCGVHIDRFREATKEEDDDDIKRINESGANIVLVGRGCPRQEFWVANHKNKVFAVMMAVGAAFDFHAGVLKQAPDWMQSSGLEWFFRLTMEPKRLWKRYLVTNSLFIVFFLKQKYITRNRETYE